VDGWLYTMGAQDFAGGIVIHITSAVSGLVVCRALGPRRGFDPLGEAFPHSNLVLSAIGLGMLWVGWFGFNAGSSFAAGAQASEAIMNTHASACCSALAWLYMSQRNNERGNKPSFIAVMNGSIAGLAAITPAAGYVGIGSSMIIGVVGGLLSHWSCHVIRERLRIDDALEVSSVHGISSIVGTLSVGLFAYRGIKSGAGLTDGRGLFFGGGFELFFIQLMAILVSAAWSVGVTWIIIEGLQRAGLQLRPPEGHEEHGIDFVSHGESIRGYGAVEHEADF